MQFKNIIGQEELKKQLIQTVHSGRISHTLLFLGPEGCGALPVAVAYAQFINCSNRGQEDSCGICPGCLKFEKLVHPDLHFTFPTISIEKKKLSNDFIEEWRTAFIGNPYLSELQWLLQLDEDGKKQGNITAEECRDIIRKLSLKSFEALYKTVIIWLPEYMRQEGNILLKLLEEPPEGTLIILVAQDSEKLLSTILSRTQTIKIPRLREEDIEPFLVASYNMVKEEAEIISRVSEGNLVTAIHLANSGRTDYQTLFSEWMRSSFVKEMSQLNKLIDTINAEGREFVKSFLSYSLRMMRAVLICKHGDQNLIRMSPAEKDFITRFSVVFDDENIDDITKALNDAAFHVERNADLRITFLNLSLYISGRLIRQKTVSNQQ